MRVSVSVLLLVMLCVCLGLGGTITKTATTTPTPTTPTPTTTTTTTTTTTGCYCSTTGKNSTPAQTGYQKAMDYVLRALSLNYTINSTTNTSVRPTLKSFLGVLGLMNKDYLLPLLQQVKRLIRLANGTIYDPIISGVDFTKYCSVPDPVKGFTLTSVSVSNSINYTSQFPLPFFSANVFTSGTFGSAYPSQRSRQMLDNFFQTVIGIQDAPNATFNSNYNYNYSLDQINPLIIWNSDGYPMEYAYNSLNDRLCFSGYNFWFRAAVVRAIFTYYNQSVLLYQYLSSMLLPVLNNADRTFFIRWCARFIFTIYDSSELDSSICDPNQTCQD